MREARRILVLVLSLVTTTVERASAQEVTLIDPTRPPSASAPADVPESDRTSVDSQKVRMILVSPTRRMAVVGGVRVEEGDEVFGAKVTSIRRNEVVLSGPTGEVRLPLRRTVAKAPTRMKNGGGR